MQILSKIEGSGWIFIRKVTNIRWIYVKYECIIRKTPRHLGQNTSAFSSESGYLRKILGGEFFNMIRFIKKTLFGSVFFNFFNLLFPRLIIKMNTKILFNILIYNLLCLKWVSENRKFWMMVSSGWIFGSIGGSELTKWHFDIWALRIRCAFAPL